MVCYNSDWRNRLVDGIVKIMDEFHTDGVYLDGTALIRGCKNTKHGCGYYDYDGKLNGTASVLAVHDMFRRLYEQVEARGGVISVHSSTQVNFVAQPFIHCNWYGEDLQFGYCKGALEDFPLDFFRSVYTGRDMGVPVEMIVYANPPIWEFKSAVSMAIIHGILPRPNGFGEPLDIMSEIWKVFNNFPIEYSEWCPYWSNGAKVSNDKVKVSYYKYTGVDGKPMLLILCANSTKNAIEKVGIKFDEDITDLTDAFTNESITTFDLNKYGYKIMIAR